MERIKTLKEARDIFIKFVGDLKVMVDCMNPEQCGCVRCPNCNIFYNKIKDKLTGGQEEE